MNNYEIIEEYDGRLPIFNVTKNKEVLKRFDSYEEAERFLTEHINNKSTSCGEENPCN